MTEMITTPLTLPNYIMAVIAFLSLGCLILFADHSAWSEGRELIMRIQTALGFPLFTIYFIPYLKYLPYECPEWIMEWVSSNMAVNLAAVVVWCLCAWIMLKLDDRHFLKDSKAGIHRGQRERNEKMEYQKKADGYNR